MAVRKRKNEKSKSEPKNDDKSENDEQLQKSSSKLSFICLGMLAKPLADLLSLKGYQFRNYGAFPISIMLICNHLKLNSSLENVFMSH